MSLPPQIRVVLCPISTAQTQLCFTGIRRQKPKHRILQGVENKRIQGFLSHQKRFDKLLLTATIICIFRGVTVFSALFKQQTRTH